MLGIPQRCLEESLLLKSSELSPMLPLVPPADIPPAAREGLAHPSLSITTPACLPCTSTKNLWQQTETGGPAVRRWGHREREKRTTLTFRESYMLL